jgi:predicted AlkP superfamily phosphohydrolase/phosphomutase
MPARLLVIGLDAAESTLIERWVSEGDLPTFAMLKAKGGVSRLANSLETLPGAIWPELTTGRSCGKVPLYYHPCQLHTGESRIRPILAEEVNPYDYYWTLASSAGYRVAVIDQPQTVKAAQFNGVQLFEWGLHDRNFEIASDPPELLKELRAVHGDHPITSCDLHGESLAGYERLLRNLLNGVQRKTSLLLDILHREKWDLFTCVYGETHCVGHQFWHFQDERAKGYDSAASAELCGAIRSVYREIDKGIGQLIRAAGDDATVLVVASHGMGPYIGGYQLLPEVLVRLGMGSAEDNRVTRILRVFKRTVTHMPRQLQPFLRRLGYTRAARSVENKAGGLIDPLDSPRTRAASLRNNRCGAIRLNIAGREPFGRVQLGSEADALIVELRKELLALEDPTTGQPIVKRVVSAAEAFGPDHHPDVPDLMVVFRTDLGTIEACRSDRVGLVEIPLHHPILPRSGDHTVQSRLWILGRGVPAGAQLPDANVLDLAPTVLQLLDVSIPSTIDGRPLPVFSAHTASN